MSSETLRLDRTAVEWRLVDDEVVALDLRDAVYLGVNPTGAVLWPLLAEGTTREELTAALVEEFSIPADQAEADVDAFVTSLAERDLFENA